MSDDSGSKCSELEPFALQVLGNSMEPEFPEDCIVIIEPSESCRSGMYVMAMVEDVRWFRQYIKNDDGEQLVALNEIYPEIILDGLEWKVEGVVIQRNLRRAQSPDGKRNVKHYEYE